jgi:hypothetical protein
MELLINASFIILSSMLSARGRRGGWCWWVSVLARAPRLSGCRVAWLAARAGLPRGTQEASGMKLLARVSTMRAQMSSPPMIRANWRTSSPGWGEPGLISPQLWESFKFDRKQWPRQVMSPARLGSLKFFLQVHAFLPRLQRCAQPRDILCSEVTCDEPM